MNIGERFRKGVVYASIAHIFTIIFLFSGLAVSVRFVSPHDFGNFVLLSVVSQFLIMLADFGFRSATIKFLSFETNLHGEIASTAIASSLIISVAILILIYYLGDTLFKIFNLSSSIELKIYVFLLFFFQSLLTQLTTYLQGLHLYGRYAIVLIFGAGTKLLLILLLVVVIPLQFTGLLIATISSAGLSCLLSFFLVPLCLAPRINLEVLKRLVLFGYPIQIGSFCAFIFERADAIMLGVFFGPLSVSIYEVGYKIPNQIRAFFEAFRSVFFPHLSHYYGKNDYVKSKNTLKETLRLVSFVMTGMTLGALLYGRELITIMFSDTYASSVPIFFVLMIGINIGLSNYFMGTALIASGRPNATLVASIPEAIVNVGLNLIFIPKWGAIGAAWASMLSRAIVNPIFLMLLGPRLSVFYGWSYLKSYISFGFAFSAFFILKPPGFWGKGLVIGIFLLSSLLFRSVFFSDIRYLLGNQTGKDAGNATPV